MRADEFVTEAVTSPYNIDFHNSVTWQFDKRKGKGVSGDFTTASGQAYKLRGMRIGDTKAGRDAKAKHSQWIKDHPGEMTLPPTSERYGGIWEVHFDMFNPSDRDDENYGYKRELTKAGDEFRVFATVIEFIRRLISEYKPEIISIISDNAEKSRAPLYNKLAKRFASAAGYELVKTVDTGKKTRMELKRIDKK